MQTISHQFIHLFPRHEGPRFFPSVLQKSYEQYQQIDGYLGEHTLIRWLVLVTVPALTVSVYETLSGGGFFIDGISHGVVFATMTVYFE